MATKEKHLSPEKSDPSEDWIVVLPRRGKKARRIMTPEQSKQEEQWAPTDVEIDTVRESTLMQKIEVSIQKLEQTEFFRSFIEQMKSRELLERFLKVLGPEEKMQMVIYGIGNIESYETPRIQLSLGILIKRKFEWIGEIEVFDPVLSLTESRVLTSLGCAVLSVNEQCRRKAVKPMMFFMPHCEAELYENLLEANWEVDKLTNLFLFGNSFELQEEGLSVFNSSTIKNLRKHILASRTFTEEFKVKTFAGESFQAFHSSSWHLFSRVSEADLHAVK